MFPQDYTRSMNAEAEAFPIIITGIDNVILSQLMLCPNACEMWKAFERMGQRVCGHLLSRVKRLKTVTYHKALCLSEATPEWKSMRYEMETSSTANPVALIATVLLKQRKKQLFHLLLLRNDPEPCFYGYEDVENVKERRLTYSCFNFSLECQKPKRVKDAAYSQGKDVIVQSNNDNYNVFAMENEHPEQLEPSNDIYLTEQGDYNITIVSSDICYDRAQDDQDENDDLDQET
ncbi:hypothetical protein Tco_0417882 [Tanacetum coccineum]